MRYEQEIGTTKDWREGRQMRTWELHEAGWKQKDIAQALGVSEEAVSQWVKKAKAQGAEALRHQPPPGASRHGHETNLDFGRAI